MRGSRIGAWWAWSGVAALVAVLLAAPAAAQVDTAVVEVFVQDSADQPLPGVTVKVVNLDTGLQRVAVAGGQGAASFPALPPGAYEVTATLDGFATVTQGDLVLRVGQTARLVMTMRVEVSETITVTAEAPIVDVFKSDASTNITPEQIQDLPTPNRDFQKLAFIAPGVERERGGFRFITGAPVVGSAGNASQATIMVDGVDFTDQTLGLARARFSQDAVREFRVINNRFDVEIGNSAGGALSVVTKSGTNEVHGSAFGFYRADSLRSEGELETGEQDYSRYQAGFTIGGPITRDATHYFASFEYIDEDNISPFIPGGVYADQRRDLDHPFEQLLSLVSLTHRPSSDHALGARLVYDYYREDNFRAGGVCDESCGMDLNRDNWNFTGSHSWVASDSVLNELRLVAGAKKFDEPNNSDAVSEYFTYGTTLQTGANITGDQTMEGDYYELRDTLHLLLGGDRSTHDLKLGASLQFISERWNFPVFPRGLLFWATDFNQGPFALPYRYDYGVGSADTTIDTTLLGLYVQDDWSVSSNLTFNLGVRYDYDTDGNNPDFTHPNSPGERSADSDNIQPRLGFVWDLSGRGESVLRGGVGQFSGRSLLVPAFTELQQNGTTGRPLYTRLNGTWLCIVYGIPLDLCPFPALDPASPQTTGVLLAPNSTVLEASLETPEAIQASLGFTQRLGDSGLYLDVEALYAEGDNEIVVRDVNWGGNSNPVRPNPAWTQVNMYTNEGRSEYTALMASLNGTLRGGHILTASVTYGDKKNISDDFSPALNAYPSDPADIEAEWGRARGDEEWRVVLSGVFRLPWGIMLAPIYEYGSGQPWTRLLGYDYNGDGRFSDRAAGVDRNDQDGPDYKVLNLRLAKSFRIGEDQELELIVEGFNVLDTTNYVVDSIDNNQYLSGPTLANPAAPYVPNPNFGTYRASFEPLEVQLGVRYHF